MPELNFPDPTTTKVYTEAGLRWTYNDTHEVWSAELQKEQLAHVGPSAPNPANQGDLWWNNHEDSGRMYVYTGKEWVDSSPAGVGGGFDKTAADLLYISKVDDDRAKGLINFQGGIKIEGLANAEKLATDADGNVIAGQGGPADSADKLTTPRNLWGNAFDGTKDITGYIKNGTLSFQATGGDNNFRFYKTDGSNYGQFRFNALTGNRTYTWPNAAGTVALTSSDITGKSAKADTVKIVHATGSSKFPIAFVNASLANEAYHNVRSANHTDFAYNPNSKIVYASKIETTTIQSTGGININCGGTGQIAFRTKNTNGDYRWYHQDNGKYAVFRFGSITGNRTITWPNKGGTVAFTDSDITGNAASATNCSRSVLGGNGLSGGGALTANRTLTVKAADSSINVSSSGIKVSAGNVGTIPKATLATNVQVDKRTTSNSNHRVVFTVSSDGNDLTSTRLRHCNTIKVNPSTGTLVATTFSGKATNCSRSVSGGDGLSGGGELTANRTLNVDSTVIRTSGNQTMSGTKTFSGTLKMQSDKQLQFGGANCRFHLSTSGTFTCNNNGKRIWEATNGGQYSNSAIKGSTASGTGNVRINSSNGIMQMMTSTRATKTAIRPITEIEAFNVLNNLQPVYYKPFIDVENNVNAYATEFDEYYGFIAEDVYAVDKRLADLDENGKPQSVNYDRVAAPLLTACKAQQRMIEDLKKRVAQLESTIADIKPSPF